MKKILFGVCFLSPLFFFTSCSGDKGPEVDQTKLPELGTPTPLTREELVAQWFNSAQNELGQRGSTHTPTNPPAGGGPEENNEEGRDNAGEEETETMRSDTEEPGRGTPVEEETATEEGGAPPEGGVEAEPLDREPVSPVEEGGIVEEGTPGVGEEPRVGTEERPPADTTAEEEPRIMARASQPRLTAAPLECDATRGFVKLKQAGRCVCDESAGFFTPPSGYDAEDTQGRKRCLRKVSQANLILYVGSLEEAGTSDPERLLFQLCKNPPDQSSVDPDCFTVKLPSYLDTPRHSHPEVQINRDQVRARGYTTQTRQLTMSQKKLEQLYFPDDVRYFMLRSDPASPLTDALFIVGLKLEVETLLGAGPLLVYDNRCANRWIEEEDGHNYTAPFSVYDDAWCLYIETPGHSYEGTDCGVNLKLTLADSLGSRVSNWIRNYNSQRVDNFTDSGMEIRLDYPDYNDFGHNQSEGTLFAGEGALGASTTYAFTVYNGHYKTTDRYQLKINCADAWGPHIVKVAHYIPGGRDFLNTGVCARDSRTLDQWLSTDTSDEGGTARPTWPSPSSEYQPLAVGNCRSIPEFRLGAADNDWGLPILNY